MLKQTAVALVLAGLRLAQTYLVEEHLDTISKVKCKSQVPKDFACAILFDLEPPSPPTGSV
jgi:hypothetical protein